MLATVPEIWRLTRSLVRLHRASTWSAEQLQRYQEDELVSMLRYAVERVPFYRSLGLRASSIHTAADLQAFPVLSKADIQAAGDALLSDAYSRSELRLSRTSGSTGQPTTTWFDRKSWQFLKYACKIHRLLVTGCGGLSRIAVITEIPAEQQQTRLDDVKRRLPGKIEISMYTPIAEIYQILLCQRPDAINAYPSYLLRVIEYCAAAAEPIPQVPIVYTSSETLTSIDRRQIEKHFGARVIDVYGSTEFKEVAWQCAANRYHINPLSVFSEFQPHEQGGHNLLLTGLSNRAMPLIRFQTEDIVRADVPTCACGRVSQMFDVVEGRAAEWLRVGDGLGVSPYVLTTAIEMFPEIEQFRIVQHSSRSIEVQYQLVTPTGASFSEANLCAAVAEAIGGLAEVQVSRLSSASPAKRPSGKQALVTRQD